ncbi:Carbamate kinase [Candidatus Glomeribacter gigasporarum BEG34]|uniref:Carbamate kinase n=1 Tax=Candidatus Glomeribacter gigasporarum BEG34 TaxID=1070319 RepID=G2J8F3_9BURK|nr:carbamate kinase [Candidatus Glomeribacter gigasporarum]CCD29050.1 Carbamate kinase [Candidatus Glomeribacter gigasporarum BEG34]
MRIVIALGGNALLKRGERVSADAQRANIRCAAQQIADIAAQHEVIIVHGNGPQVGLLARQSDTTPDAAPFPLDVLDAETEGMIGYIIEQELSNALPAGRACATLLTMVEIDPEDAAFGAPDKPIGPVYPETDAQRLARDKGWTFAPGNGGWRRVVPSPHPKRIVEMRPIRWLLEKGAVVICAGGGGIPVTVDQDGARRGVEAVIDKDRCAALLADEIHADALVIATDVPAVFADWGLPTQRPILRAHPKDLEHFSVDLPLARARRQYGDRCGRSRSPSRSDGCDPAAIPNTQNGEATQGKSLKNALSALRFEAGSMQPKVEAACQFSRDPRRRAVIGALSALEQLVNGSAGTLISMQTHGIEYGRTQPE